MASEKGKLLSNRGYREDCAKIRKDGMVHLCPEKLGNTLKSSVYLGYFCEKTPVAVRRYRSAESEEYEKELDVMLTPSNLHENFIRFMAFEKNEELTYAYIATELCECSVADLFKNCNVEEEEYISNIKRHLDEKSILRQITEGLVFLHGLNYIHCNIKPSNMLIAEIPTLSRKRYVVKVSDFRLCRKLPEESSNSGMRISSWIAPECNNATRLTFQYDTFLLGCLYFYVLKNGLHPFGNNQDRLNNISNPDYHVYREKCKIDAPVALMKQMIKFNPLDRPTVLSVLTTEPFFSHQVQCTDTRHENKGTKG